MCKNKVDDIQAEKLQRFRFTSDASKEELGRIIRGDEAFPNELPWQVSIQDEKGHVCGGAIISPNLILTAAHCYLG